MVDQNSTESALKKLFYSRPWVFADYLLNSGRLAVILLDAEGTILDCNAFFLENSGLAEKPIGLSINTFLQDDQVAAKTCRAGGCLPVKLTFDLNASLERYLSGHLLEIDGRYVIYAHTQRLTDNELVDWTNVDAAEQLFADILDPHTNEPVLVEPNTVLVMPACRHAAFRVFNARLPLFC